MTLNRNVACALLAAFLFGASTPMAKRLTGNLAPLLLAGLLYLGSGVGLLLTRLVRDRRWTPSGLARAEWPWLLGAIVFGGMLGPVALMFGLRHTSSADASLLLNLEAVLTALIAWLAFRENADRRVVLGMIAIVAGGVALAWPGSGHRGTADLSGAIGPAAIALACLCWGIDNNLTRKVSNADALFIASTKGLIAGGVNTLLALGLGELPPAADIALFAMLAGLAGYGISLVLFVLALRGLGAARTGAYFSTAPFIGAAVSLLLLDEPAPPAFWAAAGLMAFGVWLHLTEHHEHDHVHEPVEHSHPHVHDEHHEHTHAENEDEKTPHTHWHRHVKLRHRHPHFPDTDHLHAH
ncbi:MAG: EamA family transporter [Propionivibrio sp.]